MGKHMRALAILLVLSVIAGYLPAKKSMAESYNMACQTSKGVFYANTADEAFDILERDGGGTITLQTTFEWSTAKVRNLSKNMKIVIPEYALLELSGAGIQGEGNIEVYGTLDLKNSTCTTLHLTGKIEKMGRGEIIRTLANVGSLDKISDVAAEITYGQTLPGDNLDDNLIGTRVYKTGKWLFRDQTTIFEAGTHTVTVYYDYSRTVYNPVSVEEQVQIRVNKATPKLSQYTVPEIELGQKLSGIHPKYTFINPYTKEQVAGTLTFADAGSTVTGLGEKNIKASFVPNDSNNYNTAELTLQVNVVPAAPKIASLPIAGNGQYGRTLESIALSQGSCVDAMTGEMIEGIWSWKNKNEPLVSGNHSYPVVFTPKDMENYKSIETSLSVQTAPKKMTAVEWPSVSEMKEGQHLFEAELSFTSNEFGNFVWEDETQIPSMDYKGAVLTFVPFDTDNYDWSYVAGYDKESSRIKKTIPLSIIPKPTDTPAPTATPTIAPTQQPTTAPTEVPTIVPTQQPTAAPTTVPTVVPTQQPTIAPTEGPTIVPTVKPIPTSAPQVTSQPDSENENAEENKQEPVVIKKMVTTLSKIKTPASGYVLSNRPQIKTVKRSGKVVKIKTKKVKGAKYEVRYSRKKNMKKAKKKRSSKNTIMLRKLKAGSCYYIQTRVLKKKKGKWVYSKWSEKRKI